MMRGDVDTNQSGRTGAVVELGAAQQGEQPLPSRCGGSASVPASTRTALFCLRFLLSGTICPGLAVRMVARPGRRGGEATCLAASECRLQLV